MAVPRTISELEALLERLAPREPRTWTGMLEFRRGDSAPLQALMAVTSTRLFIQETAPLGSTSLQIWPRQAMAAMRMDPSDSSIHFSLRGDSIVLQGFSSQARMGRLWAVLRASAPLGGISHNYKPPLANRQQATGTAGSGQTSPELSWGKHRWLDDAAAEIPPVVMAPVPSKAPEESRPQHGPGNKTESQHSDAGAPFHGQPRALRNRAAIPDAGLFEGTGIGPSQEHGSHYEQPADAEDLPHSGPEPGDAPFPREAETTADCGSRHAPGPVTAIAYLALLVLVAMGVVVGLRAFQGNTPSGQDEPSARSTAPTDEPLTKSSPSPVPDMLLGLRMGMSPQQVRHALPALMEASQGFGQARQPSQAGRAGDAAVTRQMELDTTYSGQPTVCQLLFSRDLGLQRIRCEIRPRPDTRVFMGLEKALLSRAMETYGAPDHVTGQEPLNALSAPEPDEPGYRRIWTWQMESQEVTLTSSVLEPQVPGGSVLVVESVLLPGPSPSTTLKPGEKSP